MTTAQQGIVCDTGALVLECGRGTFGTGLEGSESPWTMAHLHLLCNTLPDGNQIPCGACHSR